jgi:hypothetical protein
LNADLGDSDQAEETSTPADAADVEQAGGRKRLVEIRCGFAELARKEAEAASARVVETKRLLDGQASTVAEAQAEIDPSGTHAAKDAAHRAFRAAVAAARGRGQVEAAAGAWLAEINRVNGQSRILLARVKHEREVADALVSQLAKLSSTAEASATMAASAIEACRAAQAAAAADDATDASGGANTPASAAESRSPADQTSESESTTASASPSAETPTDVEAEEARPSTDWLVIDLKSPDPQAIIRLVRRDSRTLNALVDRLAGADPVARSCWGLLFSNFVDSVAAAAIEDACLVFPAADAFWNQFNQEQCREVARGLAALGFRYDGFGAFSDGRVPGQRDLAMAVGSAGLLPARVRYWPKPDDAAQLFRGVNASSDTFIAAKAPALTLGELVRLLGRRADLLADLWNDWPRVRALLFATNL